LTLLYLLRHFLNRLDTDKRIWETAPPLISSDWEPSRAVPPGWPSACHNTRRSFFPVKKPSRRCIFSLPMTILFFKGISGPVTAAE